MPKVQITDKKIEQLGERLNESKALGDQDKELLVATFALAGEAVKERTAAAGRAGGDPGLGRGLVRGFKDSAGPQIGGTGPNPEALDVGVDVNVNW